MFRQNYTGHDTMVFHFFFCRFFVSTFSGNTFDTYHLFAALAALSRELFLIPGTNHALRTYVTTINPYSLTKHIAKTKIIQKLRALWKNKLHPSFRMRDGVTYMEYVVSFVLIFRKAIRKGRKEV